VSGNRRIDFLDFNVQLSQAENCLSDAKRLSSCLTVALLKLEGKFWSAENPKDMVMVVLFEGLGKMDDLCVCRPLCECHVQIRIRAFVSDWISVL
jgi:hypothetical protein